MTFTLDRINDDFRVGQRLVIKCNGEYDIIKIASWQTNIGAYSCVITYAYHHAWLPNSKVRMSSIPCSLTKEGQLIVGSSSFDINILVDDLPDHLDCMQAIQYAIDTVSKTN